MTAVAALADSATTEFTSGSTDSVGPKPTPRRASIAALLFAFALWVIALVQLPGVTPGDYGLLASPGGAVLAVSALSALIGFLIAIAVDNRWLAALAIVEFIVIARGTASVLTEVPIYAWTYKHIGLVDYIQATNQLAPASVDVYNQWPGFFTLMAWFAEVTGADPVDVAHWFTPLIHLVLAVLVFALGLGLRLGARAALTAAMIVEIVNWVGQDYYAPQAVGLLLAVAVLALLAHSKTHPAAGYVSLVVFTALVPTHQLTPYWLCAVVFALVAFRRVRPRWLPLAYLAIAVGYLLPRLQYVRSYGVFTGSNPIDNATTNITTRGSDGRVFTMLVDRSLSAMVWLLAGVAFIVLWRTVGAPWTAAIMGFSSLLLLGGQSYGGEAIFRVFLYSLPGCAMLLAPFVVRALDTAARWRGALWVSAVSLLAVIAATAGLQGYYGSWQYVVITKNQLDQSRWLLSQNPDEATITVMAPAGWPERPTADYVRYALANPAYDRPLVFLKHSLSQGFPTPADLDRLELLARSGGNTLYLVLPRQTGIYSDYFGLFKPGAVPSLIEGLSARPTWIKIINDEDTVVFTYSEGRA